MRGLALQDVLMVYASKRLESVKKRTVTLVGGVLVVIVVVLMAVSITNVTRVQVSAALDARKVFGASPNLMVQLAPISSTMHAQIDAQAVQQSKDVIPLMASHRNVLLVPILHLLLGLDTLAFLVPGIVLDDTAMRLETA